MGLLGSLWGGVVAQQCNTTPSRFQVMIEMNITGGQERTSRWWWWRGWASKLPHNSTDCLSFKVLDIKIWLPKLHFSASHAPEKGERKLKGEMCEPLLALLWSWFWVKYLFSRLLLRKKAEALTWLKQVYSICGPCSGRVGQQVKG